MSSEAEIKAEVVVARAHMKAIATDYPAARAYALSLPRHIAAYILSEDGQAFIRSLGELNEPSKSS